MTGCKSSGALLQVLNSLPTVPTLNIRSTEAIESSTPGPSNRTISAVTCDVSVSCVWMC